MRIQPNQYVKSLCWSCANAVPNSHHGCSWSREFEPVEGWTAEHDIIKDSYRVQECPEFKPDSCYITDMKRPIKEEDLGSGNWLNKTGRGKIYERY